VYPHAVPGGEIAVDKLELGQVHHAAGDVQPELDKVPHRGDLKPKGTLL